MAKKKPTGNPNWVKGYTPNPAGRPPDALNAAMKKLTKDELEDIANLIIKGDVQELQKIREATKGTPTIRVMFASIALKIIERGDMDSFDKLLNRLIGKVKDSVDVTSNGLTATTVVLRLPDNGRAIIEEVTPKVTC